MAHGSNLNRPRRWARIACSAFMVAAWIAAGCLASEAVRRWDVAAGS